nr:MAG TPA: hypothetical protein [Caudoviricetes sp.]
MYICIREVRRKIGNIGNTHKTDFNFSQFMHLRAKMFFGRKKTCGNRL